MGRESLRKNFKKIMNLRIEELDDHHKLMLYKEANDLLLSESDAYRNWNQKIDGMKAIWGVIQNSQERTRRIAKAKKTWSFIPFGGLRQDQHCGNCVHRISKGCELLERELGGLRVDVYGTDWCEGWIPK